VTITILISFLTALLTVLALDKILRF